MPELPEVEVTRQGIRPYLEGATIKAVYRHREALRWPIDPEVTLAIGNQVIKVHRRAKYLLIDVGVGSLVLHLGMTGHIKVLPEGTALQKHDHFEMVTEAGDSIRLNDSRRFGAVLWQEAGTVHPLLARLGPEPLSDDFTVDGLYQASRNKKQAIKNFIMDNANVVGVGNIYANESLFLAGIDPRRAAGRISLARYETLVGYIKQVLQRAIKQGGTTLQDFSQADGQPGYFAQELLVYGRQGQSCPQCQTELKGIKIGQRQSVYCPHCQT